MLAKLSGRATDNGEIRKGVLPTSKTVYNNMVRVALVQGDLSGVVREGGGLGAGTVERQSLKGHCSWDDETSGCTCGFAALLLHPRSADDITPTRMSFPPPANAAIDPLMDM
ncbi:hypothetical protein J1614_001697 [Plenodomus biglobosus]|nr:hypothetical protein J1614_001697 [Plenodomus biglobosus]